MIHISTKDNTKKILVDRELNSRDTKDLHAQLSSLAVDCSLEICFIEVKHVPSQIVKDCYDLKHKVKIITTQRTLWNYLQQFGIQNTYKNHYKDIDHSYKQVAFNNLKAIAIGGSAGSIESIIPIVESLPYCDITVFITIHILADKPSRLVEILQTKTPYKVCEAKHHSRIEANCIYVAPPDNHLLLVDGFTFLSNESEVNYSRPSIDVLFKSAAHEYSNSLLAILLCGYGSDGAKALKTLKDNACDVIIQEPAECKADMMPINAIKTKNYHRVMTVDEIKQYITSSLYTNITIEDEIEVFLEKIVTVYDYDFRNYERTSISRRLDLFIKNNNFSSFKQFEKTIFNDSALFDKLLKAFSINVTSFFRNPQVYKSIKEQIIPYLQTIPYIRIWCAGCSRGDEAYSIAIMLNEMGLLEKSQIYATDFNETILSEAYNGLYATELFKEFKANYIKSGGKQQFEKYFNQYETFFEVKQKLKDNILFFQHNLVQDGSINEFHVIFCRNVLIYFDKILTKKVLKTFDESLNRNGFLVLGGSERHDAEYNYKTIGRKADKIVQKTGS